MHKQRLFLKIFPSFLVVSLIVLVGVTWYCAFTMKNFHLEKLENDLIRQGQVTEDLIRVSLIDKNYDAVRSQVMKYAKRAKCRVTIILPGGKVVADSEHDITKMENHANRKEIRNAEQTGYGIETRFSDTLKQNMMYVAQAVKKDSGQLLAVVRTALSARSIDEALAMLYSNVLIAGTILAIISIILGVIISKRISAPMEQLKKGADLYAKGDFSQKLLVPDTTEIGGVADTMNKMGEQLNKRVAQLAHANRESEAVFTSMSEGLIAVDHKNRIIRINRAARKLLGLSPKEEFRKRNLPEVIRTPNILHFFNKVSQAEEQLEEDFLLYGDKERFLSMRGTALHSDENPVAGIVVVINDVTRLRQLENMRRDFVANVSHEIRTPLTAIRGAVETLQDGAMNEPDDATHFMNMIDKHANRLQQLVDDILALSRLEQQDQNLPFLPETSVKSVLTDAVALCREKASQRGMKIDLACDDHVAGTLNTSLLEQAVVNLIENAIKYCLEDTTIHVSAEVAEHQVLIKVRDEGPGIPPEHLARIFERFYRIDKSRSRTIGGTGLGLSIVKHIATAHQGDVKVESSVGEGTTFTILIPA